MKRLRSIVLFLLLALMLAACGGGAEPTPEPKPTEKPAATEAPAAEEEPEPEPEPEPTEKPEPTEVPADVELECTDEIGCVEIDAGDPINVAYMLVTSGAVAFLGEDSVGGIEIAIEDRGGEILGHEIELTGEDSLCSAEGGQTAAQKVAADDSIVGVIGTNCSSAAASAMPILSEAGLLMISSSNTAPTLTSDDTAAGGTYQPGYFRTAHNDLFQGRVAAEFVYNELGARTVATVHDGSPYADGLQKVFADVMVELGGEVTFQGAVNVGDTDMRPILTEIAANAPDVLYFPIFEPEAPLMVAQSTEIAGLENTILMGADAALVESFPENAGAPAEGMYLSGPYVAPEGAYGDLLAKWDDKYGGAPPSGFHGHAYDATMMLLDSIQAVAQVDADGNVLVGRQALRDAMTEIQDYAGTTGVLSCNETGDCATGEALGIYQITTAEIKDGNWPPTAIYTPGGGAVAGATDSDDGPEVVDDLVCEDAIGCIEVDADDPVHLAYMLVTSGAVAFLGEDSVGGIEIAIEDRGGQVLGHDIELSGEDSLCSAEGGQTAAQKVAADDSIVGVIGTNCSSAAAAGMPILSEAGLLMMSPSNTAPTLTSDDTAAGGTYQPGYFRTAHNDLFQGRVAAEFVYNELGARTVATVHDGSPYADGLQKVFADVMVELGGEVTFQGAVNVGDTDMRPILTEIAANAPDVLYFPIFEPEAPLMVAQSTEIAGLENTILMGADAALVESFPENAGAPAEGMYLSGPYVAPEGAYGDLLAKWDSKYGGAPPSGFHGHAYDGTMMLLDAIEAAAQMDADGNLLIGRQALRDAMTEIQNYAGTTGVLSCNETGDCATGEALGIYQITTAEINDGNWPPTAVYTPGGGAVEGAADSGGGEGDGGEGDGGAQVVDELSCDDAIGCIEVDADDPVNIAYMLTTSGATAFLGEDSIGGIEIAIDDHGGELLGHEIELSGEDSLCSAEGGQTAAQKVAADDTIVGVIGTNCSSAATAGLPIISEAGLVLISPSNTAPTLTSDDTAAGGVWQPGYYRTAHNDLFQGRVAAEFVYNELGARTVATVHDGSPYADGLQQVFADVIVELGGEVTFQGAVNVGDTDMRPILTEIAANAPDVLYFPNFEPEVPLMVAQSTEIAGLENTILMSADGALVESFPENAGAAAEGMYMSGPYIAPEGAYGDLLAKWDEKYGGSPPSGFHGHAYDATRMLLKSIEAAAQIDADGNLLIGRQALRDALTAIDGYKGTIGMLGCNETGDCATGEALGVYQITDAEISADNWPPAVIYTPAGGMAEGAMAPSAGGEEEGGEEEGGEEDSGAQVVGELSCEDAIGCIEVDADDPVNIAYMLTTSGATAFLGEDSIGGIEIAIDDRGGEVLGHEIELSGEDSLCSAEGGQTAAQKVAADDTIVGVIGTNCSSAATAGLPIISEAGLVLISPSNTAPTLTSDDTAAGGVWQPGYYRTAHNDLFQGRVAAEFVYNELGARTVATVHDGSPYADGLQQVFADVIVELGGEVTFQGAVNVGDTDMRPILTEIAANAPDVLYFPNFEPEVPLMAAQSTEIAGLENTILMSADGALVESFPENAGSAAEGMYMSGPYIAPEGAYGDLLAKWDEKYGGSPPSGFHGHAYDATMMLLDAIEAASQMDADGNLLIGRQALRDALTAIDGYAGTIGMLGCNETGDCATGEALGIYQVTDAEISDDNWPPAVIYTPAGGMVDGAMMEDSGSGAAEPPAMVATADDLVCEDVIGCVELASDDPVNLAYMLVTSGAVAFLGEDSVGGIEIAIDDFGREVIGHEIELSGEDSLCSAEGGQTAAQKVAADDTIVGVIGTNCSSAATAALPIISEAGLILISPSNTAPTLTSDDTAAGGVWQPGYFRTAHNDLFQGRVAAEFVYNELGARTVATVHDGSPYADGLQAVFADVIVELGGEVTFQGAVNVGDTDMRPILTEIAANPPDVLYFPIFEPEAPLMVAQSTEIAGLEDTILMGADAALVESFPENAGAPAEGMYLSGPYVAPEGPYGDLLAKWDDKYGGAPPSGFHGHAYDATVMLLQAIEASAQLAEDGSALIGRQALRDALTATSGFAGTTGILTCDATGDCATGEALGIFQITDAEISDDNWPAEAIYTP